MRDMSRVLGIDLGTTSVKVSLVDVESGQVVASATSPREGEMTLRSPKPGWAEQDPREWWTTTVDAIKEIGAQHDLSGVVAMGIAYQMHGLVLIDEAQKPTRPAIIWCDSRAVEDGQSLEHAIGPDTIMRRLLNPPGNLTASKLAWVARNEPAILRASRYAMLPGDYLAMRFTGRISTSPGGLSEMVLWDYEGGCVGFDVLGLTGSPGSILPPESDGMGAFGALKPSVSADLGLNPDCLVTFRAGDQPNNAFGLGVRRAGQTACNAGTSGVVYSVTDKALCDPSGRVNTFLHVGSSKAEPLYGILMCLNGAGASYSWLRRTLFPDRSFEDLNALATEAPAGSKGLSVLPYGQGAERLLGNADPGASFQGLRFAVHSEAHLVRATLEGVAFAMAAGMDAMRQNGVVIDELRAGRANLFLSPVFAQTVADLAGVPLTLLDRDGAVGAAIGAAMGAGLDTGAMDASGEVQVVEPDPGSALSEAYAAWRERHVFAT